MKTIFFLSMVGMIPILTWEFVLIYGARIPIVKDNSFFSYFGDYFKWIMPHR